MKRNLETEFPSECRAGACARRGKSRPRRAQAPALQKKTPGAAIALWACVACGFLVLGTAWFALFKVAHAAQVKSVPLATAGGRP